MYKAVPTKQYIKAVKKLNKSGYDICKCQSSSTIVTPYMQNLPFER